jgi:hypothetical protein
VENSETEIFLFCSFFWRKMKSGKEWQTCRRCRSRPRARPWAKQARSWCSWRYRRSGDWTRSPASPHCCPSATPTSATALSHPPPTSPPTIAHALLLLLSPSQLPFLTLSPNSPLPTTAGPLPHWPPIHVSWDPTQWGLCSTKVERFGEELWLEICNPRWVMQQRSCWVVFFFCHRHGRLRCWLIPHFSSTVIMYQSSCLQERNGAPRAPRLPCTSIPTHGLYLSRYPLFVLTSDSFCGHWWFLVRHSYCRQLLLLGYHSQVASSALWVPNWNLFWCHISFS